MPPLCKGGKGRRPRGDCFLSDTSGEVSLQDSCQVSSVTMPRTNAVTRRANVVIGPYGSAAWFLPYDQRATNCNGNPSVSLFG